MDDAVYSQARRISRGDPDLEQNILAFNYLNLMNSSSKGKKLSIGEQVNFLKNRASELKSGMRYDFGHRGYKASCDAMNKQLYYKGEVSVLHFEYSDDAEHEERTFDGKGELTSSSSIKHLEDEVLFNVDFQDFLSMLKPIERSVFLGRVAGYKINDIADSVDLSVTTVRKWLKDIGKMFVEYFEMPGNASLYGI